MLQGLACVPAIMNGLHYQWLPALLSVQQHTNVLVLVEI